MNHDQSLALPKLVGEECDQIWFVRDYVMVMLERSSITCVNGPLIEIGGVTYEFPGAESRDALCNLIDKRVERAAQFDDATVELEFDGGVSFAFRHGPTNPIGSSSTSLISARPSPLNPEEPRLII